MLEYSCNGSAWVICPASIGSASCAPFTDPRTYTCDMDDTLGGCVAGSCGSITATVASTPSAVVGSVILVAGATPTSLNGEQRVTAITANSVSFATTEANATATGTITLKVAPAGWSKLYSGTNLAAYKITSVTGIT